MKLGKEYFDKANKANFDVNLDNKNDRQNNAGEGGRTLGRGDDTQKSDLLFSDEAVIVHISGNKESSGRMLKVSNGLKRCFGWDR